MKREDLKEGYRKAEPADNKEGQVYFVAREGSDTVSRRRIVGNGSDFNKWIETDGAEVYVMENEQDGTSGTAGTSGEDKPVPPVKDPTE